MGNYLVIGGSSGIGRALTNELSAAGNHVFCTYNKHEVDEPVSNVSYSKLDVTDSDPDFSFVPDSLDGLAYCPGTINLLPFARIKPEAFIDDYQVQVIGAIKSIQGVLSQLKKGTSPSIVLFSTVAVQSGFNFHSQVAASKGAIEGLTRALAAEFAPTVRVNAIAPSLVNTPLAGRFISNEEKEKANAERHPLKRIGDPQEIAKLASFLLSSDSSWMTGQVITTDGGISTIKS